MCNNLLDMGENTHGLENFDLLADVK